MTDTLSVTRAHGGTQHVVKHRSQATGTDMTFSIFVPPQADDGALCPVVWYLSGLTCTHANVTEKGEYRRACAEHGLIFVAPDTSPRGEDVPDDPAYDFGQGAGFYLDATQEPYARNYRMETYITSELPDVIAAIFPADMNAQGITGHSMGGHGALTLALRHPGRYRSVSAFAPIVAPSQVPWGKKAFSRYLGNSNLDGREIGEREIDWLEHDAVGLIEMGASVAEILIDQGTADQFLGEQLRPELLAHVCEAASIPLTLRMQSGYDHSYYFISTFMADHLRWHAERLR